MVNPISNRMPPLVPMLFYPLQKVREVPTFYCGNFHWSLSRIKYLPKPILAHTLLQELLAVCARLGSEDVALFVDAKHD